MDDDVARKRAGSFRRWRIDCFFRARRSPSCLYGPSTSSLAEAVEGNNDCTQEGMEHKGSANTTLVLRRYQTACNIYRIQCCCGDVTEHVAAISLGIDFVTWDNIHGPLRTVLLA